MLKYKTHQKISNRKILTDLPSLPMHPDNFLVKFVSRVKITHIKIFVII